MYRKMLFYIWVYCTYIRCNFPCLIYFSIGVEYTLRFVVCLQKSSLEVLHCVRPAETASTDLEELSAEQVKARFRGERAFLFKKKKKKKKNNKWLFIDALLLSRFILFIRFFFSFVIVTKADPGGLRSRVRVDLLWEFCVRHRYDHVKSTGTFLWWNCSECSLQHIVI